MTYNKYNCILYNILLLKLASTAILSPLLCKTRFRSYWVCSSHNNYFFILPPQAYFLPDFFLPLHAIIYTLYIINFAILTSKPESTGLAPGSTSLLEFTMYKSVLLGEYLLGRTPLESILNKYPRV